MNYLKLSVFAFIVITIAGSSFAANTTTPTTNGPVKQNSFVTTHPLLHQINLQTLNQKMAIHTAIRENKISAEQKTTLYTNLKSAHQLEAGFVKSDNHADLSSDQAAQITQLLTQNQQILTWVGVSETPTTH